MWWCFVTVTTVGYGDRSPVTLAGRLIGIVTMITGIIVFAIVVIIIGGNFEEAHFEYTRKKEVHRNTSLVKQHKRAESVDEMVSSLNNVFSNPDLTAGLLNATYGDGEQNIELAQTTKPPPGTPAIELDPAPNLKMKKREDQAIKASVESE